MGLLDGALGALLGSNAGGAPAEGPLAQVLGGLVQQHGGLGGLVTQLAQGGLANEVKSWVGTGQNLPVNGGQVAAALGSGKLAQIAQQLGVDPNAASAVLAQVLPHLIDHMTPNGQLPATAAPTDLSSALTAIAGRLLR
jgi:uncharacterized protein YidB (DUF937 family)